MQSLNHNYAAKGIPFMGSRPSWTGGLFLKQPLAGVNEIRAQERSMESWRERGSPWAVRWMFREAAELSSIQVSFRTGQELPFQVEQRAEPEVKMDLPAGQTGVTDKLQRVMRILKLRQTRQSIFGLGLFGEPAWDMFLQLYASTVSGRKECVSSLCVASGVPSTTALRWIGLLERSGWIERNADPFDRRRTFVKPSHKGLDAMERFLCHPYFAREI